MSGTCSTYGKYKKCIKEFRSENLEGRDHRKDLGVNSGIILKWTIKRVGECGLD
jgi:hypothetical protein